MTSFRTVSAGGLEVFYREAGKPGAPKLLLLGGFPASSHQFRNLMPALADRFHLVAIDYPGFGNTEMPDPAEWGYSFDHLAALLEPEAVKAIYLTGHRDPAKISPDNWNLDLHFLARSNARRVQLDLFYDYRTNAAQYPAWQRRLRRDQPKTLIFWGRGDIFFTPAGGEAYLRDLPDAKLVRLDSGHFATEDRLQDIVDGINSFYDETVK